MLISDSIKEIAPALAKASATIRGAAKDGKNKHFGSTYSTLASAIEACREPLAENGLFIVQDQDGITEHNTIRLKTRVFHSSGEWIETVCETKPKSFTPQDIGSAITYVRRYGLMAVVGIAPEDDDGNAASHGEQQGDVRRPPAKNGAGKGAAQRKVYSDLQAEIDSCGDDLDALIILSESPHFRDGVNNLPLDWQNNIRKRWSDAHNSAKALIENKEIAA